MCLYLVTPRLAPHSMSPPIYIVAVDYCIEVNDDDKLFHESEKSYISFRHIHSLINYWRSNTSP